MSLSFCKLVWFSHVMDTNVADQAGLPFPLKFRNIFSLICDRKFIIETLMQS